MSTLRIIAENIFHAFILPWTTVKQLWNGESGLKVYEVFFESFPQFVFQLFLLIFIGVDDNILFIVLKVLTMGSSYISVLLCVNQHIVNSYFKSCNLMDYVNSFIYTFSDLHLRLILYAVSWVLLNEKLVFIYFIQTLIPWFLVVLLERGDVNHSMVGLLRILTANICPQAILTWTPSKSGHKNGFVYIVFKSVSNILYAVLLRYYSILLMTDQQEKWNIFKIDLNRFSEEKGAEKNYSFSICKNETTEITDQGSMYISKDVITYVLIPCAVILLAISSIEIFLFSCCHTSWKKFLFGHKNIGFEDKIDMKVRKNKLKEQNSFCPFQNLFGVPKCKDGGSTGPEDEEQESKRCRTSTDSVHD